MPYLGKPGMRIYYEVAGDPGPAPPLVLSHGFGLSSISWRPNVPVLSASRRVIAWDLRGHGRSDSPAEPGAYSHDECLASLAALLDAVGADRAVLGGLSLGGYLSLAFCLRWPARVAGLVLASTGPGFRSDRSRQQWNDRAVAQAARLERDGARGLALAARWMLTQGGSEVIDALPSIAVPALVLAGERDEDFLGAADYVAAKIAGASRVILPGAGHLCNTDQPGAFNEAVLEFLTG